MAFGFRKWAINNNNQKKRNISELKGARIGDILYDDIGPSQNLLINGTKNKRILKEWLKIYYKDEEAAKHPLIIISKSGELLEDLIEENDVFFVDNRHKCYEPFLSMEKGMVKEVIEKLLKDTNLSIDNNTWIIFNAVMEMLDDYGYETSLFNLKKFYQSYSVDGKKEQMNAKLLSHLFYEAGYTDAAKLLEKDNNGSESFIQMKEPINKIAHYFDGIAACEDNGVSFLDEIIKAKKQGKEMPLFYFAIPDTHRNEILDYLTAELEAASDYLDPDECPVLILDSVPINNQGHPFYEYIFKNPKILLTISAEDCTSLFSKEDLEKVLGQYGFYILLGKSTALAESLTKHMGAYDHIDVDEHKGKGKGYFAVLPENINDGFGMHVNHEILRVRQQDFVNLSDRELYVCHGTDVWFYKNVLY